MRTIDKVGYVGMGWEYTLFLQICHMYVAIYNPIFLFLSFFIFTIIFHAHTLASILLPTLTPTHIPTLTLSQVTL